METRDKENTYGGCEIFLGLLVPEIQGRTVDYPLKNRKNDTPPVFMLYTLLPKIIQMGCYLAQL